MRNCVSFEATTFLREEALEPEAALADYTYGTDEGSDATWTRFATNILPILQRKLQLLRDFQRELHS